MSILDKLQPNPKNPRLIKKNEFERLKKKIKEFPEMLEKRPIIYDENNIVLGGNQRLRVLQELTRDGFVIKDEYFKSAEGWTEEQKRKFIILDNISDGEWDAEMLGNEWSDLPLDEWGLVGKWNQEIEEFRGDPITDIKNIKILNLYAGIGGNRKLWGDLKITAIEYNQDIANIYKDYFPEDELIVTDAHKYLEKNFDRFDFIWSSPPCPTHSLLRKGLSIAAGAKPKYPDMKLYEEILFLQGYFKFKWVVENVRSWYDPLIIPQERGRHYYWTNFDIPESDIFNVKEVGSPEEPNYSESSNKYGFNLDKYKISPKYPKDQILRNMVHPEAGKYILEY